MSAPTHTPCLIIGSGPAGYTAAIYASRAGLDPILILGPQPGGQLTTTNDVENFPGYPDGITGPAMMEDLKAQAGRFGTDLRYGMVTKVDFSAPPFKATVDDEYEISADTVVISTGASAKWLNLPSEARLNGSGVSACAVCDGFFYKGRVVAVVGAGDTACEEASYLSKLCKKVYMIVRKDTMRASAIMQHRVRNTANIEILWNSETQEIIGDEYVTGVRIFNNSLQTTTTLEIDGFFVAIGHTPNTTVFKDWLSMDHAGYIITKPDSTRTNIEGIFACGDAQDNVYRQAVTAAGTGCMAALDAERYLAEKEVEITA
jgi:thioredoxin reductase (NADPH)